MRGTGFIFKACDKVNGMYKFISLVGMKVSMWGSNTSGFRIKSILSLARASIYGARQKYLNMKAQEGIK